MASDQSDEPPEIDREFGPRQRTHRVRQRASPRELLRRLEWLKGDLRRRRPDLDEATVRDRAQAQLEAEAKQNPRLTAALEKWAPSSREPDRRDVYPLAELAAAVAQPPLARVLRQAARSPGRRGPTSDLSGAAACLMLTSFRGGPSILRASFEELKSSPAASWALGNPTLGVGLKQLYRQVITLTGRVRPGHDPAMLVAANIELIRCLRALCDRDGRHLHPRIGEVGIVDATRMFAPVEQTGPRSPRHLDALRRPGMDRVNVSTYKRGTQFSTVIGWKAVMISDQATTLPLAWVVVPANADERQVLLEQLLPLLFAHWRGCPMHTLVGDGLYDVNYVCRELEERFSLHPVFTRAGPHETEHVGRDGRRTKVIAGQPYCRCGGMKRRGGEGFYDAKQRSKDGLERGEPSPERTGRPRIRWVCPDGLCGEVSLWVAEEPRDYTWYPRGGDSADAYDRVALEIRRSGVESIFGLVKHHGIGVRDGRALWARDSGIDWLLGGHLCGRSARRYAHESGAYALFHEEYCELGFHETGATPSSARMRELAQRRPAHLQWRWPQPGRITELRARPAA